MCRLYANTTPFYIRDMSICECWYPRGSWNHSLADTEVYYTLINDSLLLPYLARLIGEVEGISLEDKIAFTLGSQNED